jgi:hypothetical protein
MNDQIRRLTVVVVLMFLALMVASTSVQFVQAGDLNADGRNVRTIYREYGRERGPIVVEGTPIVTSEPVDDAYSYLRVYQQPEAYAHVTGYFSVVHSSMTGMERAGNEVLNGDDPGLLLARLQSLFTGSQPRGGAVELTIDPAVQAAAIEGLGDQRGAAVALDPSTGAILAMYSSPSFDPNGLASHDRAEAQAAYDALVADPDRPLLNRAIGGDTYAPGSTFKLVTASAMLESGLTPDSLVDAPTQYTLPGSQSIMHNPGQAACGDGSGETTLRQALIQSCNTPFAGRGVRLRAGPHHPACGHAVAVPGGHERRAARHLRDRPVQRDDHPAADGDGRRRDRQRRRAHAPLPRRPTPDRGPRGDQPDRPRGVLRADLGRDGRGDDVDDDRRRRPGNRLERRRPRLHGGRQDRHRGDRREHAAPRVVRRVRPG